MQCRACLNTNYENSSHLDELKIKNFNLITNLCVNKDDNMPQRLCENCTKDLKICVEFREKCISSNVILLGALHNSKVDLLVTSPVKQEGVDDDREPEITYIEIDTKVEIAAKEEDIEAHPSEDNFVYEFLSETKQQNVDDTAAQTSVLKENTRTTRPKVKEIKKRYDCGLCIKKIEKNKLHDHVNSHEKDDCGVCSLHFKEWESMLLHRISHLDTPNLMCHICLRSFPSQLSLGSHYNIKHLGNTKDGVSCRQCNKTFYSASNLYKHTRDMHTTSTFQCKHCPEVFTTPRKLKYHESKTHKKQTKCDECEFVADSPSVLKRHVAQAHGGAGGAGGGAGGAGGAGEAGACERCAAGAGRARRARCRHGTSSVVCPVCGLVFPLPDKLREHLATHSAERRYKCSRCDAAYRSWRALRVHVSKHDGVRPHKCDFCAAAFWGRPTLVKHRRLHTGERPYVCRLCGKGFTANHNLKVHMRVHGVFDLIKKRTPAAEEAPGDAKESNKS